MSSKDRIEALEAGAGVVETRTGKLAGSEKKRSKGAGRADGACLSSYRG